MEQASAYRVVEGWGELPAGWSYVEVVGAAADSSGTVFVFNRGEHPVVVFDAAGRFLTAWGEGAFVRPHGITVDPEDRLWLVDDVGHSVRQFSPRGELLRTLGPSGQASETGVDGRDYRTVRRSAGPYNLPTNLALSPSGDFYVTDGYGNARVHQFSGDGRLVRSWGEPGSGPGQFHLPHGIAIAADGTVYIADRENSCVQLFSPSGEFLAEWTDVARPCEVAIAPDGRVFVAELGFKCGFFPGAPPYPPGSPGARVSIFSGAGELLARWGGGPDPCAPGDFFAPHDISLAPNGDLYVSEVVWSGGGRTGMVPPDCHTLQKFAAVG